jgi:hypothetical protein
VSTVRFLAVLLGLQAAIIWRLLHQPLTPAGLLCWALALYSLGWTLYSLWELATSRRKRRAPIDRYR